METVPPDRLPRQERGVSRQERVLSIDPGERRVGLALAEPGQALVRGLPTLDRKVLKRTLVEEITGLVREHAVERIVLGIPYSLDGTEGPAARLVRKFEAALRNALDVPVSEWDERLTSEAARTRLRDLGYSEREMRSRLDQLSAVLILEGWLRARTLSEDRESEGRG
ncbi:MAG: Holliday junction resolvase RuvX [Gemmatimonadota bacterium]